MAKPKSIDHYDWPEGLIDSQALVVTCGPFAGRICDNDDNDFLGIEELEDWELKWFKKHGAKTRSLELEEGEVFQPQLDIGYDCEIVTFGFYLECRGHYRIPRVFLRPATTNDLVKRSSVISNLIFRSAFSADLDSLDKDEIISLLKEQSYITNEMWALEKQHIGKSGKRNVFLCHSSSDKPFVKQVFLDLSKVGHRPWLDEFEIAAGDSIIDKIENGLNGAGALVLFLSKDSVNSSWVKREWNSALARQITKKEIVILPAVVEECEVPPILADIKYADFRVSYRDGFEDILAALSKIKPKRIQKGKLA